MSEKTRDRMPMADSLGQLYGYIYCMLVSNTLLGMPLFGGALYLCGRAVLVFGSLYGKKNRNWLPAYARKWRVALLAALFLVTVALIVFFPTSLDNPMMWLMFGMVGLSMLAEISAGWYVHLTRGGVKRSRRAMLGFGAILFLWVVVAGICLIASLGWLEGGSFTVGFFCWMLILLYQEGRRADLPAEEPSPQQDMEDIRSLDAYQAYERISLMLVIAIEMTLSVIYALIATNTEWLLPAMAVGVSCTLVFGELGLLFLRRSERKSRRDPTALLMLGLVMWLYALTQCNRMMRMGRMQYFYVYFFLALCSAGGALCMVGLRRIEELLPDIARLTGRPLPKHYRWVRQASMEFAGLLGDMLALIALSVFFFRTGNALPHSGEELATAFQPVLILPLVLVVLTALLSVFRFPLSAKYIAKLRRFLHLQEAGEENPALRQQLEHVVGGHYRQPFFTRVLIFFLRPLYRYHLVNWDETLVDEKNPLVFLCNHGEINGPIVSTLYLPVNYHGWAISMMMTDKKEVGAYLYENTFSQISWMRPGLARWVANMTGWLSTIALKQVEAIPVYRDQPLKLRETIRLSMEAMEAGDNLLIFPEVPEGKYPLEGIAPISPGFLMLGMAYWKKMGKRLRILPMYVHKAERAVKFGEVITYDPDRRFPEEQQRIVAETERQMRVMAGLAEEGKKA